MTKDTAAPEDEEVVDAPEADADPQVDDGPAEVVAEADARVGGGREEADAEAEAERKAKAQKTKARRQRQQAARDRLYAENAALKSRLAVVEQNQQELSQRVVRSDGATIDTQLADVNSKIATATTIMAKAARSTAATAEQDYIEAVQIRDQLLEARQQLNAAKAYQEQRLKQPSETRQPPPAPRAVVEQAQKFASENSWFDPANGNTESKIANRISAALDAEGYDPEDASYWDELRARVQRHPRLSHLFDAGDDDDEIIADAPPPKAKPNGGPRLSSGGRERPLKRGEVYIPRELKESMQQAGIWDDRERRARVIKNYQESIRAQRQH